MRFGRSLVLVVAVVVVSAGVASGVTYMLVARDAGAHSALPPVVLTGVLRDTSGKPVANAAVELTATDLASLKVGQSARAHLLAGTRTDAAGRFTIRQSPSVPIIRKMAAENGGWVNFDVDFQANGTFMPWGVPREISHGKWLADDQGTPAAVKVERITLKSLG